MQAAKRLRLRPTSVLVRISLSGCYYGLDSRENAVLLSNEWGSL